jgi:hypothetical protein
VDEPLLPLQGDRHPLGCHRPRAAGVAKPEGRHDHFAALDYDALAARGERAASASRVALAPHDAMAAGFEHDLGGASRSGIGDLGHDPPTLGIGCG